jgi:tight adherence protein C
MDPVVYIPVAVFGGVSCLAWLALSSLRSREAKLADRLGDLVNSPETKSKLASRERATAKLLESAASKLARPLTPTDLAGQQRLRRRLTAAGFNSPRAVPIYLAVKVVSMLTGLATGAVLAVTTEFAASRGLLVPAASTLLGLMLPDVALWHWRRQRQEQIFLALPDALDLLVLCIEVGHGLDAAVRRVGEEIAEVAPELSVEFGLYTSHVSMGRPRQEALHDLGLRAGVDDLNTLAAVLIQVDRFGTGIAESLREMADGLRVKRRQLAEERAQKTSVQLVFPLVLFIFPGIVLVLVGPAAIMIMEDMKLL